MRVERLSAFTSKAIVPTLPAKLRLRVDSRLCSRLYRLAPKQPERPEALGHTIARAPVAAARADAKA